MVNFFFLPSVFLARFCSAFPRVFQGELLAELLERVFAALSRVLRNHLNAMQLIQQKLTERHLASSSPSPSSSASSSSLSSSSALTAVAPPLLNYRADVVWRAVQEEVQDMLSDYIQVRVFLERARNDSHMQKMLPFLVLFYTLWLH